MLSVKFEIVDNWGKRSRGHPIKGIFWNRLNTTKLSTMEKIWYYLHNTGSHGLRKKSSYVAERRMMKMKRNIY